MNKLTRVRQVFKPFCVGDFFFLKVIPRRFAKRSKHRRTDEELHKLSSKLQYRYAGPYSVTKVISDVLYEAIVNGKLRRVHALSMKRTVG